MLVVSSELAQMMSKCRQRWSAPRSALPTILIERCRLCFLAVHFWSLCKFVNFVTKCEDCTRSANAGTRRKQRTPLLKRNDFNFFGQGACWCPAAEKHSALQERLKKLQTQPQFLKYIFEENSTKKKTAKSGRLGPSFTHVWVMWHLVRNVSGRILGFILSLVPQGRVW